MLIDFHVQDPEGNPLGNAYLDSEGGPGPWHGITNPCGDFIAKLDPGTYNVTISHSGFKDRVIEMHLGLSGTHDDSDIVKIGLERGSNTPPSGDSPVLGIAGQFFTRNGQAATLIQCSDFNLLNRYQSGEGITPILDQRRACGFNDLRVWTAFDVSGIGTFTNIDYSRVPTFLALCGSYGFTVELTAFTGPYAFFANDDAKVHHWESLKSVCAGITNVQLELGNEIDHPANKDLPFSRLTRPSGIIASRGSMTADAQPLDPPWGYSCYHTNDLSEWQRKVGHNAMEIADRQHVPCKANENTRFTDHDNSVIHADDAAHAAGLLCCSACYHSIRGKSSQLWDGDELNRATIWAGAMQRVPLEFQQGQYHHRTELETGSIIRAYDRRLADGREYIVTIRA